MTEYVTGWSVTVDGMIGMFPIYPTRERARKAAAANREFRPTRRYKVGRAYGSPTPLFPGHNVEEKAHFRLGAFKQGRRTEMRTVAEIDRDIDAIHDEMKRNYPALRRAPRFSYGPTYTAFCERWQAAWDAEPELRMRELSLYTERRLARQVAEQR